MSLQTQADAIAAKYGIPKSIFRNLIYHESRWTPSAVSSAGAIGLTQLMPATAKGLGVDPWNPAQNMDGGARYLSEQYKAFGRWDLALAAYGWGPNAVRRAGNVVPAAAKGYVTFVLGKVSPNASAPVATNPAPSRTTKPPASAASPTLSPVDVGAGDLPVTFGGPLPKGFGFTPGKGPLAYTPHDVPIPAGGFPMASGPAEAPSAPPPVSGTHGGSSVRVDLRGASDLSTAGQKVVSLAMRYLGDPYQWGAAGPDKFDCSGLVTYIGKLLGKSIPHYTYDQLKMGTPVDGKDLRPGDILFFYGGEHEGIYIGEGKVLHAPHTGDVVRITPLSDFGHFTARRIF